MKAGKVNVERKKKKSKLMGFFFALHSFQTRMWDVVDDTFDGRFQQYLQRRCHDPGCPRCDA